MSLPFGGIPFSQHSGTDHLQFVCVVTGVGGTVGGGSQFSQKHLYILRLKELSQ
jgi:hypothetical protein